ncbi:MAG: hypothetical protein ACRBN8_02025 [Nannocystales bacterium]
MRLSTVLFCSSVLLGGCFRGRGSKGTVPVQPDLPPLPEFVEVCVSKAVVLPAKLNGKSWDGIGRANRKARKLLPDLIAASQGGGYAAALSAAGSVGTTVFNKVKGPPDLRVQMQLGREYIVRTDYVKDTAIAPFGSSEANCAVIAREEYGERVQFVVEDVDVAKTEVVGTTSFVGIPVDAIRSGSWQVLGFDAVVEIELTMQPMEKASNRVPLADEAAPPSVGDEGGDDAADPNPAGSNPGPTPEAVNTDANGWTIDE